MSHEPTDFTVLQTQTRPMVRLEVVRDHAQAVRHLIQWTEVGILVDEGPNAIVVVLVQDEAVVGAVRFCLTAADSVKAISTYLSDTGIVVLRCWQGPRITSDQVRELHNLTAIWQAAKGQSTTMSREDLEDYFRRVETATVKRGRSIRVSTSIRTQVLLESHGRCMFEGCAIDLTIDPTTGNRGSFSDLSHNLASSESRTRGVLYLPNRLASEANNILLLCDTHHRLIDTVAKADYPADRIAAMRSGFCRDAQMLLDSLSRTPIPAYCLSWPVHQQVISTPSTLQMALALAPIGARLDGQPNVVSANDATLRNVKLDALWRLMPTVIESSAARILMQTQSKDFRAALFAMGLMPSLIALGAKLGNKCEITPMLRFRENGLWYWPAKDPRGEFFRIDGVDELSQYAQEVCLRVALTANPPSMDSTISTLGHQVVSIIAQDEYMGNGSLGHPIDGYSFRHRVHKLLHDLRSRHGVELVHVLPCASNAACVFFGQAFDSYHPDLLVYDFEQSGQHMVPRIRIGNVSNECRIESWS